MRVTKLPRDGRPAQRGYSSRRPQPPSAPARLPRSTTRLAAAKVDTEVKTKKGGTKKGDDDDDKSPLLSSEDEQKLIDDGLSPKEISESLAIAKSKSADAQRKLKTSVDQVKAIATKISAARRLARKLADEKTTLASLDDDDRSKEIARRQSQLNAAEAAAAAARADAVARATRLKATTRGREVARLAAENEALLEVLQTAAAGNPEIQAKLAKIRSTFRTVGGSVDSPSLDVTQTLDLTSPSRRERRETVAPEEEASAPEKREEAKEEKEPRSAVRTEERTEEGVKEKVSEAEQDEAEASANVDQIPMEAPRKLDDDVRIDTSVRPEEPLPIVKGLQDALRGVRSMTSSKRERDAGKSDTEEEDVSSPDKASKAPAASSAAPAAAKPSTTEQSAPSAAKPSASAPATPKAPEVKPASFDKPTTRTPSLTPSGTAVSSSRGSVEDADVEAPARDKTKEEEEAKKKEKTEVEKAEAEKSRQPMRTAAQVATEEAVRARDAQQRGRTQSSTDTETQAPRSPVKPASAAPTAAPERPSGGAPGAGTRSGSMDAPARAPSFDSPATQEREQVRQQPPRPAPPPPSLSEVIRAASSRGDTVFSDKPMRPGELVRVLYDKSKSIFSQDDNEHHMQLKLGINNWEDIQILPLRKVTDVPGASTIYISQEVQLPDDLFAFDFVVQDFRSSKVDNNLGSDYTLPLVDAFTEEEVLERRAQEYEIAEEERLARIQEDEDAIADAVEKEATEVESEALHEWWRARRAELREQARQQVAQIVEGGSGDTVDKIEHVFCWREGRPMAGKQATLYYNRDASELRHRRDLVVHIGFNNWDTPEQKLTLRRLAGEDRDNAPPLSGGDWYLVDVDVPERAQVIDFVMSDAEGQVWDNNHGKDFHTAVKAKVNVRQMEEDTYKQLLESCMEQDTESANRAAQKAGERVRMRAKALAKRRAQQRRVLYTIPLQPEAGEDVEVYYNPDATSLRGRPEVYLRGSWNRWSHPDAIPTTKLEPAFRGGIGFLKATVKVPSDALMMDLVFLDSADLGSGFYDNNEGLDYHVPVTGASGTLPPLSVAHISVEMAPIAKVGGMGDVVTALGRSVQDYGHKVEVVMPKFDCMKYDLIEDLREIRAFHWGGAHIRVFRGYVEGLPTTFLEPDNGYFWVGCVYGRNDDAHRFGFFCGAALEYLKNHADGRPDIVHCHDWPTAPVAFGDTGSSKPVFTIHNLNYGQELIGQAMSASAVATTVSPTYAREVSGHPAVSPNLSKMFGVRNGIDVDIWDPSTDKYLPTNYNIATFDEGKAAAKRALRQRMNLADVDVPIIGVVTRLTHQKGIHLIKHAAWRTLERGGQFVLLGSAPDPRVQGDFDALANDLSRQYNDRARLTFLFDEPLSHLIYAGCDMMLVPSMFEPCGLTQMIGMRYGTVPVVRKTGGLADTVFDIDDDHERAEANGLEVNGFNFEGTDNGAMDYALNRAISTWYNDRSFFRNIARRCMTLDWSWNGPAQDYIELYYKACKNF